MDQSNRKMNFGSERTPRALGALFAGIFGGFVASYVMDRFQNDAWPAFSKLLPQRIQKQSSSGGSQEPATVIAAEKFAASFHRRIPDEKKNLAGNIVHYLTGSMMGAAFGLLSERYPQTRRGAGLPYGTAMFLLVDEGAVPVLGLSKPPKEYPFYIHLYAFISHLVFGLTLYAADRGARAALRSASPVLA